MDLYTKNGRPLQVSGDTVYGRSGKVIGRISGDKVYGTDGRYVGTIDGDRTRVPLHRPSDYWLTLYDGKYRWICQSKLRRVSHMGRRTGHTGLSAITRFTQQITESAQGSMDRHFQAC